jgi:tetratricopeptide (TPR) repeat protein
MKYILSVIIVLTFISCSNPFRLNILTDDEINVIEKTTEAGFTTDTLSDADNSLLISASRKYIYDSQPDYAENLLNCVNTGTIALEENFISYHYLRALIFSEKNNPGSALSEATFAVNRCEKILSSLSYNREVKENAEFFLADLYSFNAVLYRSIGRADRAYELLGKSIAIYEKSDIPALKKLLARNYIYAMDIYTLGGRFAEAAEYIRRLWIFQPP